MADVDLEAQKPATAPGTDTEAVPPDEETPLLKDGEVKEDKEVEEDGEKKHDGPLKDVAREAAKEKIVAGFGATTFGLGLVAVMLVGGPFVWVTGIGGLGLSVYTTFQQQKLTQIIALNQTNEVLSRELGRLKENREELDNQVKQMTESVNKLKDTGDSFDRINAMQGDALKALEEQLEETKRVMSITKCNLQNEVMSNIMEIALQADDGDFTLSDEEVQSIIDHVEGLNGVEIREEKLKQVVKDTGGDIGALMDVLKNLMAQDVLDEDKIFVFMDDA